MPNSMEDGNDASRAHNEVLFVAYAVATRVPSFWSEEISLWFRSLEAQFFIVNETGMQLILGMFL